MAVVLMISCAGMHACIKEYESGSKCLVVYVLMAGGGRTPETALSQTWCDEQKLRETSKGYDMYANNEKNILHESSSSMHFYRDTHKTDHDAEQNTYQIPSVIK